MTGDHPRERPHPKDLPFVQGDLVEGEVTTLAHKGGARAVARGVLLRVAGGVPGDRGELRIVHVGRNAIHAKIHALTTPSPDRVEAPCPVVDRCGGCPWQHASIDVQRATRDAALEEAVGAMLVDARRHPWSGAAPTTGYRTRALMMARHRAGRLTFGFYAAGSQDLVPAEGCAVQHPILNEALEQIRTILEARRLSTWRSKERPGLLRAVSLRLDPAVGHGLATLVMSRWDSAVEDIAAEILRRVDAVSGVYVNLKDPGAGGAVLAPTSRHLAGARRQAVGFGDVKLDIGPTAFIQTHHAVGDQLVEVVADLLPDRMSHLVDAYSGVGVLGLAVRHRARRVTLIERDAAAVADARFNVAHLGTRKVDVIEAATADGLGQLDSPPDAIILDPPRAGCGSAVLKQVVAMPTIARVVHVSCGLAGLKRDLEALVGSGAFRVTDVTPLDMFVHTPHAEVVLGLERVA